MGSGCHRVWMTCELRGCVGFSRVGLLRLARGSFCVGIDSTHHKAHIDGLDWLRWFVFGLVG